MISAVVSRQFLSVLTDKCCGLQTVSRCNIRQMMWFYSSIWAARQLLFLNISVNGFSE